MWDRCVCQPVSESRVFDGRKLQQVNRCAFSLENRKKKKASFCWMYWCVMWWLNLAWAQIVKCEKRLQFHAIIRHMWVSLAELRDVEESRPRPNWCQVFIWLRRHTVRSEVRLWRICKVQRFGIHQWLDAAGLPPFLGPPTRSKGGLGCLLSVRLSVIGRGGVDLHWLSSMQITPRLPPSSSWRDALAYWQVRRSGR